MKPDKISTGRIAEHNVVTCPACYARFPVEGRVRPNRRTRLLYVLLYVAALLAAAFVMFPWN